MLPKGIREAARELNECRQNPAAYAETLSRLENSYMKTNLTLPSGAVIPVSEGVSALQNCIEELRRTPPRPPVRMCFSLCEAAKSLCRDLQTAEELNVEGGEQSRMAIDNRIDAYGAWSGVVGIALLPGVNNEVELVWLSLIDDGTPSRGHRSNLLFDRFTAVGMATSRHPKTKFVGVMILVENYEEDYLTPPVAIAIEEKAPKQVAAKRPGSAAVPKIAGTAAASKKAGTTPKKAGKVAGAKKLGKLH